MKAAHAALGASSADRWMNCPGSVALSEGLPDTESVYAQQGTLAHLFAANMLLHGKYPEIEHEDALPEDFYSAVELYVSIVQRAMEKCELYWVEEQATIPGAPTEMYGTPDFIAYYKSLRMLDVTDFKFGQGHAVPAFNNPQLKYYALLALLRVLEVLPDAEIDNVCMTIVQPRAPHPDGSVRTEIISVKELREWEAELMKAAERTIDPDAPRIPGPWCRWCKAIGLCPEKANEALAVAQHDFADEPITVTALAKPNAVLVPKPASAMTPEELSRVLAAASLLEDWVEGVRNFARGQLEAGQTVPGWKLVAKRATRKWLDEADARFWATEEGMPSSETFKEVTLSPNQMEKALGRGHKVPDWLVTKVSSGTVLAPEYDERPAVGAITAADDFAHDILNVLME